MQAGHDKARPGMAWRGYAWQRRTGQAWLGALREVMARHDSARLGSAGEVRRGQARYAKARPVLAKRGWLGRAVLAIGAAWYGVARRAGRGTA